MSSDGIMNSKVLVTFSLCAIWPKGMAFKNLEHSYAFKSVLLESFNIRNFEAYIATI